jgi:hypothetical protein
MLCTLLVCLKYSLADQNSPLLDHALKFHCSTSDCAADTSKAYSANIELRLEGLGFHRSLHYAIQITCHDERIPRPPLNIAIIQPLPAAIYANIYELDAASLAGKGPEVSLFGEIDVESIEKFSQPTALAMYTTAVTAAATKTAVKGRNSCGAVNISIPLHGRYPRAVMGTTNLCLKQLLQGLLVDINLPPPVVLVQPPSEKEWSRTQVTITQPDSGIVVWSLPAGDVRLQTVTSAITTAVVCGAAAAVLYSILFYFSSSSTSKRKKRM